MKQPREVLPARLVLQTSWFADIEMKEQFSLPAPTGTCASRGEAMNRRVTYSLPLKRSTMAAPIAVPTLSTR